MYICLCNAITESQIKDRMGDQNLSASDLRLKLGIGTECGSCIAVALELIKEKQVEPSISLG